MGTRNPYGLLPRYYIVVDVETTGLSPHRDEIVEIAAFKVDTTCDTQTSFSTLIKTKKPIPISATEIHGITDEMVAKDGRPLDEVIPELYDFIGMHPLVMHNAEFDIKFIEKAYSGFNLTFLNEVSCTLKMAKKAFPRLGAYRLDYLAKLSGKNTDGMHRALADCLHTARLYLACVEKLKKTK